MAEQSFMTAGRATASAPSRGRNASAAGRLVAAAIATAACLASGQALAAGCEGANASGDSGARSSELAIRMQQAAIDQAKGRAGLIPMYMGVNGTVTWLEHDGYRLKQPVQQVDCAGLAIAPITQLQPFKTTTVTGSVFGELDLTRSMGGGASAFKIGGGVGGKQLETRYRGFTRTLSVGDPTLGVNVGNGDVDEEGIQLDLYTLLAYGQSYFITALSYGVGSTDVRNQSFRGPGGTVVGGGFGGSDYQDFVVSTTLGQVFTLARTSSGVVKFDLSGALLYSNYDRDGFRDSTGIRFTSATTSDFSGKIDATLAYDMAAGGGTVTPFLRAGVRHRFHFDSSVGVFNPQTGVCGVANCDFPATFKLTSDDTFWRLGTGIGATFNGGMQSGVVELFFEGSGDSNQIGARAQFITKVH